jgi:hypothetical protein
MVKASQEAVSKDQQRFFIGYTEIPGVQSVRPEYTNNAALVKYLGYSKYKHIPRGPQLGGISLSSLLISDDLLINYTGAAGFNGSIVKQDGTQSVGFTSGYLTSYSSRYSFGSLPQIDVGISVLGNLNQPQTLSDYQGITGAASNLLLKVPGPGCLTLNIDEFATNRIISYDINIQCNRNPVYYLGNAYPTFVELITPLEVTCSFQIDINDYQMKDFRRYPFSESVQNLSLAVNTFDAGDNIATYNFNDLFMIGEAYETTINGNAGVSVQYKGFY